MIRQTVRHYAEGRPRKVMVGKLTKDSGDIRFDRDRFTDLPTDHFYPLFNRGPDSKLIRADLNPVVDRVSDTLVHVIHHVMDLHWTLEEKP